MKDKILIVEDEKEIADVITLYLKKECVETIWAETGEEALSELAEHTFNLIILDINLPGIDGYEALRKIRRKSSIPVIIVSARQEDSDMIFGFGTGADDYVTKPFSPSVLVARIRAHLRRSEDNNSLSSNILHFGPFELDRTRLILIREGRIINLSPREMDLLVFLSENPGKAFSQDKLYKEIWGNAFGDLSTVSVHVRRLRRKLEENPAHPVFIRTRYGFGYYFQGDGN